MRRRDLLKGGGLLAAGTLLTSKAAPAAAARGRFDHLKPMLEGMSPPTEADYAERRDRLRKHLREAGAKSLLISGVTSLNYFTGVRHGNSDRFFGIMLFEEGEPVWITPYFEKPRMLEDIPEGQEVRAWHEDESPMALAGNILRDRKIATAGCAMEIETPYRYVDIFTRENPATPIVSGFEPVRRCRMRKTAKELSLMRRANELTKRALLEVSKQLEEGMTESSIRGMLHEAHRKLGGRGTWALVLAGPNSAFPHGTRTPHNLKEGDIILIDTGCNIHGYQSDVTRTWVFGKPSDRQRQIWDVVKKAQNAAMKELRPGNPCKNVDAAARKVIDDAGFGPDYKLFQHRLGHGIGMQGHEEPYMVRGNELILEPGMTTSNEPGVYIYGELGVRIEDCVAISEEGGPEVFGARSPSIDNPFGSP